jgi:hypothetical protein
VAATEVVIEPSGRSVRIESDYVKLATSWGFLGGCTSRPFVHYRVSLPRAATLKIHDYKSALVGLSGALDLKTLTFPAECVQPRRMESFPLSVKSVTRGPPPFTSVKDFAGHLTLDAPAP